MEWKTALVDHYPGVGARKLALTRKTMETQTRWAEDRRLSTSKITPLSKTRLAHPFSAGRSDLVIRLRLGKPMVYAESQIRPQFVQEQVPP